MLFNKQVDESRFNEVFNKLQSFNWYPKQTNAFELYIKNGSEWSKVPTSELTYKAWDASWQEIPKEMIEYFSSLPEFDAAIFKEITGLDAANNEKQELLKKADELIQKAEELKTQANKL